MLTLIDLLCFEGFNGILHLLEEENGEGMQILVHE
jgi:hypothetical protein